MPGNGKYTPELAEKIAKLVADGVPQKFAAQACGIHETTFINWMNQNSNFSNLVQKMRSQAIYDRIKTLKKASEEPKHWTAAAWWLERQEPDHFGTKPEKKDITINLQIRDCTRDRDPRQIDEPAAVKLLEVVDCLED